MKKNIVKFSILFLGLADLRWQISQKRDRKLKRLPAVNFSFSIFTGTGCVAKERLLGLKLVQADFPKCSMSEVKLPLQRLTLYYWRFWSGCSKDWAVCWRMTFSKKNLYLGASIKVFEFLPYSPVEDWVGCACAMGRNSLQMTVRPW